MGGSGISWTIFKSFAPCFRQITTPVPHYSVFYDSWVIVYLCHKHVLCEYEGDLVCICINTTAVVQEKSGLPTCTVRATSIHWQNVNITAGVLITVVTTKTCPLFVVMVSASRNISNQCRSFFIAHKLSVLNPWKKFAQLVPIQL